MKKHTLVIVVGTLIAAANLHARGQDLGKALAQKTPAVPAISQFDADVSQCRHFLRGYCAITQELMNRDDADLRARAAEHLQQAMAQWQQVRARYAAAPPAEYARDTRFGARLAEIADSFQDMHDHLAAGRFAKSFQACGHACGLFVNMHEENNLAYAMDRLFQLRRTAKTVVAAGKIGGSAAMRELVPELLHQRNRVLLAPCPCPGDSERCRSYRDSVKTMSALLDDLAVGVGNDNSEQTKRCLAGLLSAINKAYGLAI